MSPLLFDHNDQEQAFAAIQNWSGRVDAVGRWQSPLPETGALRIDGSGNSWARSGSAAVVRIHYTLIGDTMLLNINIANTSLTVAAATNTVYVRIPDGHRVKGNYNTTVGTLVEGRAHYNLGYILNNGTTYTSLMIASPQTSYITVQTLAGTNLVTSSDFTVNGQILFEWTKDI